MAYEGFQFQAGSWPMWAQDANGQLERWKIIGRAASQADTFSFDWRSVDGDVAGNLRKSAPVDGFIDPCAAAVDSSDWFR